MSAGWRLVPAGEALDRLPTLARWHHAEWARLYADWSEEQALAELLFQDSHRHLAFAKALNFHFGLRFQQLFLNFRVQFRRRHRDGVAAL